MSLTLEEARKLDPYTPVTFTQEIDEQTSYPSVAIFASLDKEEKFTAIILLPNGEWFRCPLDDISLFNPKDYNVVTTLGFESVIKNVKRQGNAGGAYVPADWIGGRVLITRIPD